MKWKYYPLAADDKRATGQILANFQCADRTLARKLRARFPLGTGESFAIALEDLDFDSLPDFQYAAYQSGKRWNEAAGTTTIPIGDRTNDGLISFLTEYLRRSDRGVVFIQDGQSKRSDPWWDNPERLRYCLPTRRAFYGEEVFNVLTPCDTDPDLIEETIRDGSHYFWFVGICAQAVTMPEDNLLSDEFLDELVAKTEHIVVMAFDSEGYLVWTPRA
jgi:hypothetical protein